MLFNELLSKNKESIINRWFDLMLNTYPQKIVEFTKNEKNQFTNPVGYTIKKGMEDIFDGFLKGYTSDNFSAIVESIIKIKALEEITPSEAISFIFFLKQAIREKVKSEEYFNELLKLESKIDNLSLMSFDIFMKCKEKIDNLKANEEEKYSVKV